jgi:hypothetical protein
MTYSFYYFHLPLNSLDSIVAQKDGKKREKNAAEVIGSTDAVILPQCNNNPANRLYGVTQPGSSANFVPAFAPPINSNASKIGNNAPINNNVSKIGNTAPINNNVSKIGNTAPINNNWSNTRNYASPFTSIFGSATNNKWSVL